MLDAPVRAVAVLSYHASPLGDLGRGENGGMNLAIRRFCEGLSRRGVPTDVFVRRDDPVAPAEELIGPRSRLIRLEAGPPRPIPKAEGPDHIMAFARAVCEHARSERRRYRLMHAHYWMGGLVAERLRPAWGIPWVQSFHTLARAKAEAGIGVEPGRVLAEQRLTRAADLLLTASRAEAEDLIRLYGAPTGAVRVVRPGVELPPPRAERRIRALRRALGLRDRRVILCAGRLEPLKGIDLLIEAMALLARRPELGDVVCVVAGDNSGDGGRGGGERRRLEQLAGARGIADRVRFVGAVAHERLTDHYAMADVCAVPSLTETFGFVALEAQAMGTPVVATAVGGLVEVVEDGVTGLLVPTREPARLAGELARLLEDNPLRERMGQAARERAAGFGWATAVDRLSEVYDGLGRPPRPVLESLALGCDLAG